MEEKPQEKTDEEKRLEAELEATREHRAEKAALEEKLDEPPAPKTAEAPPTTGELQLIDRLRKAKQFGRDSFYLNVMLGHSFSGKEFVSAILSLMEHQTGTERGLAEFADRVRKEQAKTRAVIGDLEKSASEGEDELRVQAANIERVSRDRYVEMQERVDYLDDLVVILFTFLAEDRAWQESSIFRSRRNRPAVPKRPTLERYLADNTRTEDLPDRLREAAEATVDLATRVAAAGEKDCESCEREEIAMPCQECAAPAIPEPIAVVPPGNTEALERARSEIRQAVENGLAKGKGEPS